MPWRAGGVFLADAMQKRRQLLMALGAGLLGAPVMAAAQPRPLRIGFLGSESAAYAAGRLEALRAGLRDLGYGAGLALEFRWAEGHPARLRKLVMELLALKPDLFIADTARAARAAGQVGDAVPVIGVEMQDATGAANLTGFSVSSAQLAAKRLELLKEVMPRMRRAAVLQVSVSESIEAAIAGLAERGVDGLLVPDSAAFSRRYRSIAEMALAKGMGAAGSSAFAQSGGLVGYSPHAPELYRRAAVLADKILKGAKPAELPIGAPSNYELLVSARTAKRFGFAVPGSILSRSGRLGGMN